MIWRIYRYYNTVEDKSYIGQTVQNVNKRASNGHGYHKDTLFRESIDKYGWDNFEQSILRLCTSQEEADHYERYFIEKYNSIFPNGYNLESGGKNGQLLHSKTKQKISESRKGTTHTEDTKEKMSESHRGKTSGMKDKHHSQETRQVISNKMKRRNTWSKETHWYNNGIKNVRTHSCPEGFVLGRLFGD